MKSAIFNPDRKIIYFLMLLALVVPLVKPLGLPIPVSAETRGAFDYISSLKPNAKVLMSIDFGPSVAAELQPEARAIMRHLAERGIKTYVICTSAEGDKLTDGMVREAFDTAGKKYGEDAVYLGYVAGGEAGLSALGDSITSVIKADSRKTPVDQIPMMKDIKKLSDFDLVVAFNGSSVAPWIRQAYTRFKTPVIFGVMAVMAPGTVPYVQSKQAVAMLTGLKGAAEYETLMKAPGLATASMDAQSMAHLLIIGFIVLGNIGYYSSRRTNKA